jgi:hypothetical protein
LQSGGSRSYVVNTIWNSAEHRGLEVDRLYETILGRPADAGGRAAWTNALLNGTSEMDMARAMLASSEFQASHASNASYVSALYATTLRRTPTAAEVSGWSTALQNGASRDAAALAFLGSSESFQLFLDTAYMNFLHRAADPAGEQAWLKQLVSGQATPSTVCTTMLASDEFFALARKASMS